MEQFNYCLTVGQTDVGKKRAANEDNMGNAVTQNGLVSVVCDGMGGHVGGATASKIAVNAILENLNSRYYEDPRIAIGESIDIANRAILDEAAAHPELSGMGSTCVLLIVRNGKVYIGHVGDSRIYLIRSKKIVQLTKDHSYVQMLVDRGEITKEQAEHHPRKNEITNALGIPNMSPATVAEDALIPEAGDCYLLCSDGLSGMVPDDVINKVVSRQTEMNAQERVNRLIALANSNGGLDNITAQMVEFTVSPGAVESGKKIPMWLKIVVPAVILAGAATGAYFWLKAPKISGQEGGEVAGGFVPFADTTCIEIPAATPFKANSELVSLVFGESSLIFQREGKQIYQENTPFDSGSLKVLQSDIDVVLKNDVRVLKFTDNAPKEDITVYISSKDSSRVYKFIFSTKQGGKESKIAIQGGNKREQVTDNQKVVVNKETIKIDLGKFKKDTGIKLIFQYSAIPSFRIGGIERQVSSVKIDEIKGDHISFDSSCWEKKFSIDKKLLTFTYVGKASQTSDFKFVIPCVFKDSIDEVTFEVTLTASTETDGAKKEDVQQGGDTLKEGDGQKREDGQDGQQDKEDQGEQQDKGVPEQPAPDTKNDSLGDNGGKHGPGPEFA